MRRRGAERGVLTYVPPDTAEFGAPSKGVSAGALVLPPEAQDSCPRKDSLLAPLTSKQIASLAAAIKTLDPEEQYVQLDAVAKVVSYADEIIQHELISSYTGDEELVRAYFVAWLCTEGGYAPSALELEKRYNFGRDSRAELDIRVRREDDPDEAFALLELKAPSDWKGPEDARIEGQLFAMAGTEVAPDVLAIATVDVGADGGLITRAVTIAYSAALTYPQWVQAERPHVEEFPVSYNQPLPEPLTNTAERGLREDVTSKELDRIRKKLHNRLWGGSRDDNQIYAWLVKLLLTKIHDEKTTDDGEPYEFQVLHQGSKPETVEDTLRRIEAAYADAFKRYIDPNVVNPESLAAGPFTASEVQWVVKMLQGISVTSAGKSSGDLLGAFFESITRDGFKQSKGLFFTHYNIAIFMLNVLDVTGLAVSKLKQDVHPNDRLPYIIDPSAGSGTFLLAAMRVITKHVLANKATLARNTESKEQLALRFPETAPNTWAKDFIYGIEKREDLAMSTKVNMVLHRDGHTRVYHDDGLAPLDRIAARHNAERLRSHDDADGIYSKKVAETFDVIVTNPPFSIELDGTTQATLPQHFDLASERNSENLFLERWYQLLKHGGRLGAVLPESFFSTAENQSARVFLLLHFDIRAVVTLPPHAFQPWTPTRTSLLFAQKKSADDEKLWVSAWESTLSNATGLLAKAQSGARTLATNSPRLAAEKREGAVDAIDKWLTATGTTLLSGRGTADWGAEALKAASIFNLQSFVLRSVMRDLDEGSYFGLMVDEIGYRRTRRAESDRRNDLFTAVRKDNLGRERRVRNLNSSDDGWEITLADDADDALSYLKAKSLWS